MERDQAIRFIHELLRKMVEVKGSDLFLTAGFPPAIKVDGRVKPVNDQPLTPQQSATLVRSIMNDRQTKEFDASKECNFAISPPRIGRFRVSAFIQQGHSGAVMRTINTKIPTFEELELPPVLKDVAMTKRGLVLVVGGTGSGKSTTLAAMVGYRNDNSKGHIITIEDPVEYVHTHKNCVVTQREIGIDTEGWHVALKNTLRQAPDVILIGEIRARETMDYAVAFAETGHLCLATLHANNANQTLDRIINFFPEAAREQVLVDLSLNLRAVVSQRLLPCVQGGRIPAVEVLLSTPYVRSQIERGEIAALKDAMKQDSGSGMQTFDEALFQLYDAGRVTYADIMQAADSRTDLALKVRLRDAAQRSGDSLALDSLTATEAEGQG